MSRPIAAYAVLLSPASCSFDLSPSRDPTESAGSDSSHDGSEPDGREPGARSGVDPDTATKAGVRVRRFPQPLEVDCELPASMREQRVLRYPEPSFGFASLIAPLVGVRDGLPVLAARKWRQSNECTFQSNMGIKHGRLDNQTRCSWLKVALTLWASSALRPRLICRWCAFRGVYQPNFGQLR